MTRAPLAAWIYGVQIATVHEDTRGRLSLSWSHEALERWSRGTPVLSAKVTVGDAVVGPLVKAYLDGLLPEGNARVNFALAAGVPPDDTFGLIRHYGLDAPGAAIFAPLDLDHPEQVGHYEALDEDHLAERIRSADQHSPAAGRLNSSTLPGMVPKIAVHRSGGQWYACKDGAASTWIIKRGDQGDPGGDDIIDTEVACLHLARRLGLTDIDAEILEFADVRAIAVSRYDRQHEADGSITRWHQEDLAQAIGLNTSDPNRKFQWGSSMPSLAHAAKVLLESGADLNTLLRLVSFSTLVGNTDMHAKNISFLRYADGSAELTPAYDIAMHLHHARGDRRRFALDVNGKQHVDEIGPADVIAEAVAWGMPERRARATVDAVARDLSEALDQINRRNYPGVTGDAWQVVADRAGSWGQGSSQRPN